MADIKLYPFQQQAVDAVRKAWAEGQTRTLLSMPTGAGKTYTAGSLILAERDQGNRVLWVVHRISLLDQAVESFQRLGLKVGLIQASRTNYTDEDDVIVASINTLRNRDIGDKFGLVMFDEGHVIHKHHEHILETWTDSRILSLSATPLRVGLGLTYTLIRGPTTAELIQKGYLSPSRCYVPTDATFAEMRKSLTDVTITTGDYAVEELAGLMGAVPLVGNAVKTWKDKGEGRPTLAFAVSVAHAHQLADAFNAEGITCEVIEAKTKVAERQRIFANFKAGRTRMISSVGTMTEGTDLPAASCLLGCRPTKSAALQAQMAGRILRISPGKSDAVLLDLAGNVLTFGPPEAFVVPPLSRNVKPEEKKSAPRAVACERCGHTFSPTLRACPACGTPRPIKPFEVYEVDGDLSILSADGSWVEKLDPDTDTDAPVCLRCGNRWRQWETDCPNCMAPLTDALSPEIGYALDNQVGLILKGKWNHSRILQWLCELLHVAKQRGYHYKWVKHQMGRKFKLQGLQIYEVWYKTVPTIPPGNEVRLALGMTGETEVETKQRIYQELASFAKAREFKQGWVYMKWREKFPGEKPPYAWRNLPTLPVSTNLKKWLDQGYRKWKNTQDAA